MPDSAASAPAGRPRPRRRVFRRFLGRAVRVLAWGFAAALLAAVAAGSHVIRELDSGVRHARGALGGALKHDHGVVFCCGMDGRRPVDLISNLPLEGAGSESVPGVFGDARRFDGRSGENLVSAFSWTMFVRHGGTVALRVRAEADGDLARERRILWDRGPSATFGLRLRDGRIEAVFTDEAGIHALSAPFDAWNRFAAVVVVLAPDRASLRVDGREVASAPVSGALRMPPHTLSFGTDGHYPCAFSVDDVCVWRLPLSGEEAEAYARASATVERALEPWRSRGASIAEGALGAFRGLCRAVDRLVPSRRGAAAMRGDLPSLDLRLSARDERWFRAAHLRALANGSRTRELADTRRIRATFQGRTGTVRASLLDAYDTEAEPERRGYVLWGEPGFLAPGAGAVLLVPPEIWGERHPEAPRPLPLAPGSLVRLTEDGDFRGLFVLEPFDEDGGAWRATGRRNPVRTDFVFFDHPAPFSLAGGARTEEELDERYRAVVSELRADARFPWSGSEAAWRARRHASRRRNDLFAPPALSETDLLGPSNPAPLAVVADLDLAAAGPGVAWRSDNPAIISDAGRVSRPDGDLPAVAVLTATFPDGSSRAFRFRVQPRTPRLPVLSLHFGEPLEKTFRRDFTGLLLPAGASTGAVVRLVGSGARGAGAHHRGNTSYVKGAKRSMTLRFDEPFDRGDGAPAASRLLLLSGYADPTRLRNRLCYGLFEAMPREGGRLAVPVSWAEVCFNGAWAGVWETAPRVRDVLGPAFSDLYKVRSSLGLWSMPDAEGVDRIGPPAPVGTDPDEPFRTLSEFVILSTDEDFAARVGDVFDLDELADFWILLNFSGNVDGRVTNQIVGRRVSDGRWILLPWDYDKTFLCDSGWRMVELSNPLFERLGRTRPDFRERLRARWTELRAGPFSDDALLARIDADAALLSPLMDEEWRLLRPAGFDGEYDEAVRALREEALFRARVVDSFLR